MIGQNELVDAIAPLDAAALLHWIDLGWVMPHRDSERLSFDPSDVARVRLICELHYDLRIEEDSLSVVLSLMDQLYASRRALSALTAAVQAQPAEVRARVKALVESKL